MAASMATLAFSSCGRHRLAGAVLVGLLPAFLVFFVRRFVDEPPVYKAMLEQQRVSGGRSNGWRYSSLES